MFHIEKCIANIRYKPSYTAQNVVGQVNWLTITHDINHKYV